MWSPPYTNLQIWKILSEMEADSHPGVYKEMGMGVFSEMKVRWELCLKQGVHFRKSSVERILF